MASNWALMRSWMSWVVELLVGTFVVLTAPWNSAGTPAWPMFDWQKM